MNKSQTKKRRYRKITSETVAKHRAAEIITGNGSAAVGLTDPEYTDRGSRAFKIAKKSKNMPTTQYINQAMEQIAGEAVRVLGELVHSSDEAIATRNVHYAIDQTRGKAVTKSIALTGKVNIQSVLD